MLRKQDPQLDLSTVSSGTFHQLISSCSSILVIYDVDMVISESYMHHVRKLENNTRWQSEWANGIVQVIKIEFQYLIKIFEVLLNTPGLNGSFTMLYIFESILGNFWHKWYTKCFHFCISLYGFLWLQIHQIYSIWKF